MKYVTEELGGPLAGAYLFGSVALDDYRPPRSDLDVAIVATRRLGPTAGARLAARLDHRQLPCPARGLELVVYAEESLVAGRVAFELNLNTGPGLHEWQTDPGSVPIHWFVLDVAIGRERGKTLVGPPPADLFPPLPRERILSAIRESLDWHIDHGGGEADPADTVLNACRAWRFLDEGRWSSKSQAGAWALARAGASGAVEEALARRGGARAGPSAEAARGFASQVRLLADRL